jgi:ABC-type siderophore export system fused ATPase/permease subunit
MIPMGILVLFALSPGYDSLGALAKTQLFVQVLSTGIWVLGTVAGMLLFLGMLAYLFMLDPSSWKLLWLVVFLFTGPFGSSFYFFRVYRRQVLPRLGAA